MIPLLHDFTDETVLVFGGGPVGARKARKFAREARVVVVSPQFADTEFGAAKLVRAAPDPADVPAWFDQTAPALAVVATDNETLNDRIAREASERGVLSNHADEHGAREVSNVAVPATVRDGPVVAAVATGGRSPALSRVLRQSIESELAGAGEMASLTADLRDELQERGVPRAQRRAAMRAVVRDEAVWKALDSGTPNPRQVAADVISDVTGDRK